MKCNICGKETDELCGDLTCRDCHVSVSWEDCNDRTWNARLDLRSGTPLETVRRFYPTANYEKLSKEFPDVFVVCQEE